MTAVADSNARIRADEILQKIRQAHRKPMLPLRTSGSPAAAAPGEDSQENGPVAVETTQPASDTRITVGSIAFLVFVVLLVVGTLFIPQPRPHLTAVLTPVSSLPPGYGVNPTSSLEPGKASQEKLAAATEAHNLGVHYVRGEGVPVDSVKAREFFLKGVAGGVPQSAFNLGAIYEKGFGVPRDLSTAWAWYTEASEMGDPAAAAKVIALEAGLRDTDKARARVRVAALLKSVI